VDPPQGFMQLDLRTSERKYHYCGQRSFTADLEIVPKSEAGATEKEDAIWLIANVFDASVQKTYFLILDGERFDEGPVAKVWLKHHIPHAIHGCWQHKCALDTAFLT